MKKKIKKDCSGKKVALSAFCCAFLFANFDKTYAELAPSSFRLILVFTQHCRKCFNRKKKPDILIIQHLQFSLPSLLFPHWKKKRLIKVFKKLIF